jgi:hypothetical protein
MYTCSAHRCSLYKIWNSANGQNLHVLPRAEDAEITGIAFIDNGIVTVGWSRKIVKYPDIISDVNIDRFVVLLMTFACFYV